MTDLKTKLFPSKYKKLGLFGTNDEINNFYERLRYKSDYRTSLVADWLSTRILKKNFMKSYDCHFIEDVDSISISCSQMYKEIIAFYSKLIILVSKDKLYSYRDYENVYKHIMLICRDYETENNKNILTSHNYNELDNEFSDKLEIYEKNIEHDIEIIMPFLEKIDKYFDARNLVQELLGRDLLCHFITVYSTNINQDIMKWSYDNAVLPIFMYYFVFCGLSIDIFSTINDIQINIKETEIVSNLNIAEMNTNGSDKIPYSIELSHNHRLLYNKINTLRRYCKTTSKYKTKKLGHLLTINPKYGYAICKLLDTKIRYTPAESIKFDS